MREDRQRRDKNEERVLWAVRFERLADGIQVGDASSRGLYILNGIMGSSGLLLAHAIEDGVFGDDLLLRRAVDTRPEQLPIPMRSIDDDLNEWGLLVLQLLIAWLPYAQPDFDEIPVPRLEKWCYRFDGLDVVVTPDRDFVLWLRSGIYAISRRLRSLAGTLLLTPFQKSILKALEGRALKKEELAAAVCGGADNGNLLYRPNRLKELRNHGLVKHKRGIGFYRPDCPPPNALP